MKRTLFKAAKRWLILGHRWLGIATGLLFALWIGSGLVMLYVPFPSLNEPERLALLRPIDWERVGGSPDAALAAAGPQEAFSLEMRGDEPVYRLTGADGTRLTLSSRSGLALPPVEPGEVPALVGRPGNVQEIRRDQWTVTARYDRSRPFYRLDVDDEAGTQLYVSRATGEVALDTTRSERGWNWLGAVVHWIYPTPLRARPELWRQAVLWLSGTAVFGALSGLVLGVWRLRLRRRYPSGAVTPYRGNARWHHLFGLAGGLSLTTFIVSGWLSMNPNRWFSSPSPPPALASAYAGPAGPIGLGPEALRGLAVLDTVALRFSRVGGRWLVTALSRDARRTVAADSRPVPDAAAIVAAAMRAFPEDGAPAVERLSAYDLYWYPHHDTRPLPVLRLRFADADATWLHIDPRDGALLNRLDRSGRVNRWLFSAFHRLDLPLLIFHRPAWDAAQWLLNALAAGIAVTGLIGGWRRLRRRGARTSSTLR